MQTTNQNQTGTETVEIQRGRAVIVKSFGALKDATIDADIDKFALMLRQGIDTWRNAGKLLVDIAAKQPNIFDLITKRHPHISRATLETFARIGRNEIWPPLLADSSLGARRLLECHYEVQKRYADEPIKVAIAWKGGTIKTVEKRVSELSRAECSMVFGEDGKINTLDQQAWRLNRNMRACHPQASAIGPNDPAPAYPAPRMVNVDIGYFSLVIQPDGTIKCEPCGKSPIAQPVRVVPNGTGHKSAIVVYYKQEMK